MTEQRLQEIDIWEACDKSDAGKACRELLAEVRRLQQQDAIVTLAVPLEEELSDRIDETCKHLATEQGFTLNGIARLLIDVQRRMAADWAEIGRVRREQDRHRIARIEAIEQGNSLAQRLIEQRDAALAERDEWHTRHDEVIVQCGFGNSKRTIDALRSDRDAAMVMLCECREWMTGLIDYEAQQPNLTVGAMLDKIAAVLAQDESAD